MPIIKPTTDSAYAVNGQAADSAILSSLAKDKDIKLPLTREDYIKRQGTIQAAMQSPGLVAWAQNYEDYKRLVRDFAEFAMQFVENK